jgi:hypothetical protein
MLKVVALESIVVSAALVAAPVVIITSPLPPRLSAVDVGDGVGWELVCGEKGKIFHGFSKIEVNSMTTIITAAIDNQIFFLERFFASGSSNGGGGGGG